jgi:hypothetical protein
MIPFLILLAFELARNWYVIERLKQTPNHSRGLAFRVLVILFVAFAKFDLNLWPTVRYCIGAGLAFWFSFDVGLNLLRGKVWNYTGKDAVLDRFNSDGWWIVKAVLCLCGIWLILGV